MNKAGVALLAMRIAALYLGLLALNQFASVGVYLTYARNSYGGSWMSGEAAGMLAAIALLAIGAAVLFLLAPTFARRFAAVEDSEPMEIRAEVGALVLRLLGIVLWSEATRYLSRISVKVGIARVEQDWSGFIIVMATMAILVTVGAWFFFGGRSLARRLFGATPASGAETLAAHVQPIAYSVIGVWLAAWSLPGVLAVVVKMFGELRGEGDLEIGYDRGWFDWANNLTLFVVGVLLFIGSRRLSQVWWRLRGGGAALPRAERAPEDNQA